MTGLLLIGGGGHCKAAIDVIECAGGYDIAGVIERKGADLTEVLGYPVLGTDDDLAGLLETCPAALVTIGQIMSAQARIQSFDAARLAGAEMPVITSPMAHVSRHAQVGAGTLVMHRVTVNASANVGENCILNSHCLIEHDATVGDHCHVSTGALVNGGVVIEQGCFIGSGAIVKQGARLGANSVIGAGCVVLSDVPADQIVRETPWRSRQ